MTKMGKGYVGVLLGASAIVLFIILLMQPLEIYTFYGNIPVLYPKGAIGVKERDLLLIIQAIMLLVIIPVYILTFVFSWKYSSDRNNQKYDPDLIDNKLAEAVWWGLPLVITAIIVAITWVKTYELDPYKPIASDKKAMTVQAVALQWKWLFIYPEEGVATVNFVQFPKETPIHFEITADAPMNSLWIPDLGGQIYAMPNMKTELNLIANKEGDFRGSSANLSGDGFAGMNFIAKASTEEEYKQWLDKAKQSSKLLNFEEYNKLAAPSSNNPPELYKLGDKELFHAIMMKYMPKKSDK